MTAEQAPFARAGGMSTVMRALPQALNMLGHDARVIMPRYLQIDISALSMELEGFYVPTENVAENEDVACNVRFYDAKKNNDPEKPNDTYFLENLEYYEQRANIYGYADDAVRWALLCRGALEFIKQSRWKPDIIIATDWQAGFLPNYLKTVYKNDPRLNSIAVIFSIHNLSHQGSFKHQFVAESDFDDGHSPIPSFSDPRLLKINGMRRGIMYADAISTVSPTYTKEIASKELGEGLDSLLREKNGSFYGILNGIDTKLWDPSTNIYLKKNFSAKNSEGKQECKKSLQERFNLAVNQNTFVLGMVSRMSTQKGFDLIETALPILLEELDLQFVIVGEGETRFMDFFQKLQDSFPEKVGVQLKFENELPHQIFAGTDASLIPSKFEPCGLTQMEAMRYGSVPIVRKTGGLADTVFDYDPVQKTGTGFVFEKYDPYSLIISIVRAYETFKHKVAWTKLIKETMSGRFSWADSAKMYEKMILETIAKKTQNRDVPEI